MAEYQVIARRYRPQTFSQVLGQELAVAALKNSLRKKRLAHAYLFSGGRGCGKTTLARLFAKALNCAQRDAEQVDPCNRCPSCREIAAGNSLDVIEIDGASHRGIDDIRQINETVGYTTSAGGYKVYIIDEVHMLTKEAFNALLKTLEEPPERVIFLFATTEPHKIPSTILSRCQRYPLRRPSPELIQQKLSLICQEQQIAAEPAALSLLAHHAEGAFRDAESLLDQLLATLSATTLRCNDVEELLGWMGKEVLWRFDAAAAGGNYQVAFEITEELFDRGKDYHHFLSMLLDHLRYRLLAYLGAGQQLSQELAEDERHRYEQSSKLYPPEQCMAMIDQILEAQEQLRFSPTPRFALEALLLRLMRSSRQIPAEQLLHKLASLEERAAQLASGAAMATSPSAPAIQAARLAEPMAKAVSRPVEVAIRADRAPLQAILPTPSALAETTDASAASIEERAANPLDNKPLFPQYRYDTLLQFAAVELEGQLEIHRIQR